MKMIIVVGARPNFMKASPLIVATREHNRKSTLSERIQPVLVHTGQHYDEAMSGSFFADLDLPKPDVHLGVGSGTHAAQTAEIMRRFEGVLLTVEPDVVVVVGDVNSTVACALVTAKISFDSHGTRPLVAHVEAGLRSFDRTMPEEVNRIVTDHVSDLLFVTEESGIRNLKEEGISEKKIHFVGNTMIDSLLAFKDKADASAILDKLSLRNGTGPGCVVARYALLTLHRPSNVDHRETFLNILEGLRDFSGSCPVIFPAHPRTLKSIGDLGLAEFFEFGTGTPEQNRLRPISPTRRIRLVDPLGYLDFLCLMKHASLVVTDSGGIQEEAPALGKPVLVIREVTERTEGIEAGTAVLIGTSRERILHYARKLLDDPGEYDRMARAVNPYGDGTSANKIVDILLNDPSWQRR